MKDSLAVGLSVAAFAVGCATVAVIEADKVNKIDAKFNYIAKGINYVQENVDLTVPEEVASEMVKKAAQSIANEEVHKVAKAAANDVKADVNKAVKTAIKDEYEKLAPTLKDKLEKEINVQTIERIEQQVSAKVAKQILTNYTPAYSITSGSKADIIKTCVDSGMASWEIENVLKAIK